MYQYWLDQSWIDTLFNYSHVYVIEMKKHQTNWFFFDVAQENISRVVWTPTMKQAHVFLTEEAVEEFKAEYISPRKTSIIRITNRSLIPY